MNRRIGFSGILIALIVSMLFFAGSVSAAAKDGPIVTLSTSQNEFGAAEDVLVTVTLSNPTAHSLRILKWFTPVNGLEEPIFTILRDGEPVEYTGAVYKRPAATGRDYLTLKAGQSVAFTVNLGDYYDLTTSGEYQIQFAAQSVYLFSEKGSAGTAADALISDAVVLKIEGRLPQVKPTPPPPPPPGGTSFNGCSLTQQAILYNAREKASIYAAESESYLARINSGTQRYTTWFGTFTSSRYNTVSSHFTSLSDAWDTAGVTFDCKCKQNYYAYVYPTKPYTIYLCKVFWQAPLTGTDSQAGTLIHEMSHFDVVAGTDDFVYGQTAAKNLAITNPDNAVMNADNHEYFAENTPALP